MANRAKRKGNDGEAMVEDFLRSMGVTCVRRRSTSHEGSAHDDGDLLAIIGGMEVCVEVKAQDSPRYSGWYAETQEEKANAGADIGLLVHKPKGKGARSVREFPCMVSMGDLIDLALGKDAGNRF